MKIIHSHSEKQNQPDYILLINFVALIVLGLIILSSASYFMACQEQGDCYFYLKHQLLRGILPGLFFFFLFYFFDYKKLKKVALFCLPLTIILLVSVFIPGLGFAKGEARRWINLGFLFQPAELAKLAFIIYLSAWLTKHQANIKSFKEVFWPFLFFLVIISGLIISQPDLGTLIVFVVISVAMYFIAGISFYQLGILFFSFLVAITAMIKMAPYRLNRMITFLHPESDPWGIGYHVNQAIMAVSSGGWFGRGLGYSARKIYYLPEVVSDSIFAVLAEELGFILTAAVVVLYLFLTYRIFRLALLNKDMFARLLSAGLGFLFIFQAMVNMGAMLGILPLTGIPLPLIGYGGTNFVIFCAAFGILANISKQTTIEEKVKKK
ncbi:MAG: putative peptidoglycan glycosyltransferase FtsW [Patescibacteria group bacterium]|jgi:cell division protein FtsW|nr:putative peptidoglycan glycosyltransferase FtsW [Patescibacteria group bacterium]